MTTTTTDSYEHVKTKAEAKLALNNLMGEYKQVFKIDGHLRTMKGDPMQIHIKTNVKVTVMNVCTPRKTPLAYLDAGEKKNRQRRQAGDHREGGRGLGMVLPDVFCTKTERGHKIRCRPDPT